MYSYTCDTKVDKRLSEFGETSMCSGKNDPCCNLWAVPEYEASVTVRQSQNSTSLVGLFDSGRGCSHVETEGIWVFFNVLNLM